MALETWIDTLTDAFNFVYSGALKVKTYHLYSSPTYPAALAPNSYPCALTYPTSVEWHIGDGASYDLWYGKTEIHVVANQEKTALNFVIPFAELIRTAVATHVTLGGLVSEFSARKSGDSMEGPITLQYGTENPHWGYVVYWRVKVQSSQQLTG